MVSTVWLGFLEQATIVQVSHDTLRVRVATEREVDRAAVKAGLLRIVLSMADVQGRGGGDSTDVHKKTVELRNKRPMKQAGSHLASQDCDVDSSVRDVDQVHDVDLSLTVTSTLCTAHAAYATLSPLPTPPHRAWTYAPASPKSSSQIKRIGL